MTATPRRFMAPRDVHELQLARIWADVLRHHDFGVRDDFFAVGGDAGAAERVLAATAAQFAARPTLQELRAGPTIEALGCHLRARGARLDDEVAVPLQPHGRRRPLFLLPGGEGNVLNFHDLARRIGPDQPLIGLQTRGLFGERPPFARVEDAAADHLETMRAVQPRGPYLLAGHCSGGMVALEIAVQLQRRGERAAVLAVCDAWSPAVMIQRMPHETFLDDIAEFYDILAGGFRAWFGIDIGLDRETLLAHPPERRAAYFMDLARRRGVYAPDTPDDRVVRMHALYSAPTNSGYLPRERYRGALTYLRAIDSKFCETPTEGWEHLSSEPLRLRMVPGNHVTLLTEPHVQVVAAELRAAIAGAGVS